MTSWVGWPNSARRRRVSVARTSSRRRRGAETVDAAPTGSRACAEGRRARGPRHGFRPAARRRSGPSPATGASPLRGPRTADEALPSPDGASPAEAPESADERSIAHCAMSDDAWTLGTDPRRRAGSEWVGALRRVQTAPRPRDVEFKIGFLSSLLGCPLTPCPPGSKPPEMRSQGLGYRARLPRRCRPAPT